MTDKIQIAVTNRRDFILGASATAALLAALPMGATTAEAKETFDAAMKRLLPGAKPTEGKVTLDLPEIAENGRTVPFGIEVAADNVKSIYLFATGNPSAHVTTVHITPMSAPMVKSRMRLGKTQDVVAIAVMNDGSSYMGKRTVKVTIGGCGG